MSENRPITPQEVRAAVLQIVPALPESDDAELLFAGVIDSLALMEVAQLFEEEFKVALKPKDMKAESFSSVAAMTRMLNEAKIGDA